MDGIDRMTPVRRVRERRKRKGGVRTLPPARSPFGEYKESVRVLEEFFRDFERKSVSYPDLLANDFLKLDKVRSEAYDRCFKCGVVENSPEFAETQERYARVISRIDYEESCRPEDSQGAIIDEDGERKRIRGRYGDGRVRKSGKNQEEDREPCRISPEVKKHMIVSHEGFGE